MINFRVLNNLNEILFVNQVRKQIANEKKIIV